MKTKLFKFFCHPVNSIRIILLFPAIFVCQVSSIAQVDSADGIPVEFELQRTLQPGESGVGLNGTFNNWGENYNRHPFQMKNTGNNVWKITVPLFPDTARKMTYYGLGFYEYKFVTYRISGSDTSISSWIPDPNNSRNDPNDNNNSILYVTDPLVYSLLPINGLVTKEKTPKITAKITVGLKSHLNVSSIKFMLDGVEIPNSSTYYDSTTHSFGYQVPDPLSLGTHTIILSVKNDKGYMRCRFLFIYNLQPYYCGTVSICV